MLVGRCVKYHLWPVPGKYPFHHLRFGHINQVRMQFQLRIIPEQFLLDAEQVEFAVLQQYQRTHCKLCQLPAQFGANRAAGAGNQHCTLRQTCFDTLPVQRYRFPPQQILDHHFAQLIDTDITRHQITQLRHSAEWQPGGLHPIHDPLHLLTVRRGYRQHDQIHRQPVTDFRQPARILR